jgi:DNA-binding response OmpR family regulator
MDGFKLLKTIRQDGMKLPVLILTAKQSFSDKQTGFIFGTDDYMTKPVNFDELHWRIDALLRRSNIASERIIRIGNVTLDEASYTISKGSITIELPPKEFDLIYKLLSYPGMIFTKNQLLDEIWGYDSESSEDTVKTHVSRLRNKLVEFNEFEIVTIKGLGYKGIIREN